MKRAQTILAFAAVTFSLLAASNADAALVGYWKLDEAAGTKATDSSGWGHHGTVAGQALWRPATGRIDGAIELDVANDYVTTGFLLNPAKGPFSAMAWVKGGGPNQTIIAQASGIGLGQIWLGTDHQGQLIAPVNDGMRDATALVSQKIITDGKWHHVALVWDGLRRRLYVDGVQLTLDNAGLKTLLPATGGMYFGAERTLQQGCFWAGLLDDVRIYDSALSKSDISNIVEQAPPGINDTVSVVAIAPKTIYAGSGAAVSVTAMSKTDGAPALVPVTMKLLTGDANAVELCTGITDNNGRFSAQFVAPDVTPGAYTLQVNVTGLENPLQATVQVKQMPVLLIETDKPIYKPGQKIQARVLVLNSELRPNPSAQVAVEITDGKGVKIFRKTLVTNAFGVAPFDLDLASELNFGTWKITAQSGSASTSLDVRVEKYVLPRFEVDVVTGRDYFLVDEQIIGTIEAKYFFGKPVDGTVEIKASRYVGLWEQYATYTGPLADGALAFTLPAVGYVSGTSGAGGSGGVQLDITVTDTSDHKEKVTKLLKIVKSGIVHQLIPPAKSITPGQPFDVLAIIEDPDGKPLTASGTIVCEYYSYSTGLISKETIALTNITGSASVTFTTPEKTSWAQLRSTVEANSERATAEQMLYASYSPSDSFVHLTRGSDELVYVGDTVIINVYRTHKATVYYDVFANGHTVWSNAVVGSQIVFQATQQMVPSAKVVAYVINPNSEISADTLPLEVALKDAADLKVTFDANQVLPGDSVQVSVQADTQAMVGIGIVDESVYALNEGRLNMQEVFDELERLFMEPQAETHQSWWNSGAYEVFDQVGLQVLASGAVKVPSGQVFWRDIGFGGGAAAGGAGGGGVPGRDNDPEDKSADLAEVTRIRQFFPETWLWTPDLLTDVNGAAKINLTAPDSITTWRLHAASTSANGLGITESKLLVFQEFFGEPDLPYAVTRGEEFPVRIQIFNYIDTPQLVRVELAQADWFELLEDSPRQEILVGANSVGLASFAIRPTKLGLNTLDVTLRSPLRADAVRKTLLVEPEGTQREWVQNGMIRAGQTITLDANMPDCCVDGSGKVLLSITPSLVAQSINGAEDLLHMPYGCGEQNMIFFAPDVEILRYLQATSQLTPEVRAKAEHFVTVGYQRELTYQRADGSFSAFGDQDQSGSLWLTAFVMGTFSGARDVTTIDPTILAKAASWIKSHQLADGSWKPIGFVHHQEMLGGAGAGYPLTAFVAIALTDYGAADPNCLNKASQYLQSNLADANDSYALAIASLAFVRLGNTTAAQTAITRLLERAITDADGIHWEPLSIETTAYAALSLIATENPQANAAIKWLALHQNSQGGFGSTQDTVMALKALMTAARAQSRNVDLTVTASLPDGKLLAQFKVDSDNFDVLQIAELPSAAKIDLAAKGSGEVRYQLVRRFNVLLEPRTTQDKGMALDVVYDANHVEVDDIVNVTATVRYFGDANSTGMMIVDVGVPTGFTVVQETLDALVQAKLVSRADVAGRKVIFYVDNMTTGEVRVLRFQVKARFPVRATIPDSKVYLYYSPDVRAESAGKEITVGVLGCRVDFRYLANFTDEWLVTSGELDYDLNANGKVDFEDYQMLADNWGQPCP
jgi:CD109 antigen